MAAKLANLPVGTNQHRGAANLPTQAEAAEMLRVSPRSIRTAREVIQETPAVVAQAVERGAVAVSLAAQVADF